MTPATTHRPARKVRTPDGATAHLPAVDLLDAATASPFWCDCDRRVGDVAGVFDVRWCSRSCRAKRLGGAA